MQKRPLKALLKPQHRRINGKKRVTYPVGCALCQFGVPCTDKNPMHTAEKDASKSER
ncbi:MAG: hypothetical protein KKH94_12075 [Candidatus Omnitrophica bacterium]|nr:hypothetical protein [Candidatus Omnitrophota bacterium]